LMAVWLMKLQTVLEVEWGVRDGVEKGSLL
jgi:hypothetical protein